jgi:acyl carrier protein
MVNNLNDTELYERIRLVLKEFIPNGTSPDNISPDTRLLEDLNVVSVRFVDLMVNVEDTFGIRIEDGWFQTINTVGDLVTLVKGKVA